jgi:hypothetical protein
VAVVKLKEIFKGVNVHFVRKNEGYQFSRGKEKGYLLIQIYIFVEINTARKYVDCVEQFG